MEEFFSIIVLAILVEAIWEILGSIYKDGKVNVNCIATLSIGIILAISTNLNVFDFLAINISYNIIGLIITGILISRGSNYLHDLISKLERSGEHEN